MKQGKIFKYPEKYKDTIIFSSKIKAVIDEEKDKYLAKASLNEIRKFLPDIDTEKNIDLLPFSANLFVGNQINRNDDGVGLQESLLIADTLKYKFLNLEHSRIDCKGVILNVGFSEFGTDKPLTREELKDYTKPFNCTVGGVIWRVIDPDFADYIEESNDPNSDKYLTASLSFEIAFCDYNLMVIDANKHNFEDGVLISDGAKIKELEGKLRCYGGVGTSDEGKRIARIPVGDVLGLGAGAVANPAGLVKGIATPVSTETKASQEDIKKNDAEILSKISGLALEKSQELIDLVIKSFSNELLSQESKATACPECGEKTEDELDDDMEHTCAKCGKKSMGKNWKNSKNKQTKAESEKNISQSQNPDVNSVDISKSNIMKIKKIQELNDETLKECKAADIQASFQEMLDVEVKKISDEWVTKIQEKDVLIKAANDKANDLQAKYDEMTKKVNELTENHNKLVQANQDKERVETFSARMETVENKFNLTEKQKDIVANKVKKFEKEEEFTEFLTEAEEFYPKRGQTAIASTAENTQTTTVTEVVKNATQTTVAIPNAATTELTLADKAKKAFGVEGWTSNGVKRKNK